MVSLHLNDFHSMGKKDGEIWLEIENPLKDSSVNQGLKEQIAGLDTPAGW